MVVKNVASIVKMTLDLSSPLLSASHEVLDEFLYVLLLP